MPVRRIALRAAASAALLSAGLAAPASAVEFRHPEGPFVPTHNCTCRFDGQDLPLGARRCLATAAGPRAAECVMEQNVTSWRPSREPCPLAFLAAPD